MHNRPSGKIDRLHIALTVWVNRSVNKIALTAWVNRTVTIITIKCNYCRTCRQCQWDRWLIVIIYPVCDTIILMDPNDFLTGLYVFNDFRNYIFSRMRDTNLWASPGWEMSNQCGNRGQYHNISLGIYTNVHIYTWYGLSIYNLK